MRLHQVALHRLAIPLTTPYHLAFGDVTRMDTVLVEIRDAAGAAGWGEATVVEAYSGETIDAAWAFCAARGEDMAGLDAAEARALLAPHHHEFPFAVTALVSAMEMLEGSPLLRTEAETRVPLLVPVNGTDLDALPDEVEALIAAGYGTLKVKVGFDVDADLERFAVIQRAAAGRVLLRLDGNQGFGVDDACRFASSLDGAGIELFEQPCAAGDWEAACAVARVSAVPMMLDESIFGLADIERAAELGAAKFIKLKLMKMGGLEAALEGLERIRALGMEPVLGNGVASDVGCWMEACLAARAIRNAGEMNGFLKPVGGILATPLRVEDGAIVLAPGFVPEVDAAQVAAFRVEERRFAGVGVAAQ
jgi:L-alanine-DL-glutamate epimerase-like enolase superfamily enzyme